jgi:hypothetical protein
MFCRQNGRKQLFNHVLSFQCQLWHWIPNSSTESLTFPPCTVFFSKTSFCAYILIKFSLFIRKSQNNNEDNNIYGYPRRLPRITGTLDFSPNHLKLFHVALFFSPYVFLHFSHLFGFLGAGCVPHDPTRIIFLYEMNPPPSPSSSSSHASWNGKEWDGLC